MEGMKDFIVSVIERGGYKLDDIEIKIKRMYIIGDITESEMTELLQLAADSVDNSAQIDLFQKIIDLEHRVEALETADFVEWKPGYVTKKGEIVKFDLNGDGVLDYVMYYGGRTETSLGVGKINGWYKVTSDGTKTHTVTRNSDGTYTLTPL
jgi:hypothetical protein